MAWEDSASIDCARVMRGMASMAKDVTPASASALAVSGAVSGWRKPISTLPSRRRPISSSLGGATLATTSPAKPWPAVTLAPASSKAESGMWEDSPAPGSSTTSTPSAASFLATSGTQGDPALALGGLLWDGELHLKPGESIGVLRGLRSGGAAASPS